MNHIVCPACFEKNPREEKCCSHGSGNGVRCVECGATRAVGEAYWSCLGTMRSTDGNGKEGLSE